MRLLFYSVLCALRCRRFAVYDIAVASHAGELPQIVATTETLGDVIRHGLFSIRHDVLKRVPRPDDYSQGSCVSRLEKAGGGGNYGTCHVDVMVGLALVMAVG